MPGYQTLLESIRGKGVVFTSAKDADAAILFAQTGAKVVVGHDSDSADAVAQLSGVSSITTTPFDVADFLQVASFFELAVKTLGNVDIIIANSTRAAGDDWFSKDNTTPTNVRPDMSAVNVNMYGLLYTVHHGANALRKNPTEDKVFVFDGDASHVPELAQSPIFRATLEPSHSCTQGMASSGRSEKWRSNVVNPLLAVDQAWIARGKPYNLTGIPDEKVSRRHAILVAATIQDNMQSIVVKEDGLILVPHPIVQLYGLEKVRNRLYYLAKLAIAKREGKLKKWFTAALIFGCTTLVARRFF